MTWLSIDCVAVPSSVLVVAVNVDACRLSSSFEALRSVGGVSGLGGGTTLLLLVVVVVGVFMLIILSSIDPLTVVSLGENGILLSSLTTSEPRPLSSLTIGAPPTTLNSRLFSSDP